MFLKELKEEVLKANLDLPKYGLVTFTWGNASGIDRERGLMIIKPSGVPYDKLQIEHLVVLDLEGKQIEGSLRPSSDSPTHLVLYRHFNEIGGIVHSHSTWATSWAQSGKSIPPLGTTHADYFYGDVPCTRKMTRAEIEGEYERETGQVIVETFKDRNPMYVPGVLVEDHGPFTWGKSAQDALYNSVVLEEVAKMAFNTLMLESAKPEPISPELLDRHFLRKHGVTSYYGQNN